jgi:hypothetical protein
MALVEGPEPVPAGLAALVNAASALSSAYSGWASESSRSSVEELVAASRLVQQRVLEAEALFVIPKVHFVRPRNV